MPTGGNRPYLKGGELPEVLLSFRKAPLALEQATYDPYEGLRYYGPYRAADVKILHLMTEVAEPHRLSVVLENLEEQIRSFLEELLEKDKAKVKIEREKFSDFLSIASESANNRREFMKKIEDITKKYKEYIVLTYLPRYALREEVRSRVYARVKALGLQKGFISQFYSERLAGMLRSFSRNEDTWSVKAKVRNLSLNILAKAGGIPWALYNKLEYDIVVGMSWSIRRERISSTGPTTRIYGVVHTFSNAGVFETFRAFACRPKEEALTEAIQKSLDKISEDRPNSGGKVLIMTRERLKKKFLKRLSEHLKTQHGYDLDVVGVFAHTPIRMYDPRDKVLLAPSGLYFMESDRVAYLITTGKREKAKYTGIGVPRPVKVEVLYHSDQADMTLKRALVAAHALTAMNWRSFWGSLRLPVPVHYALLVAQTLRAMDNEDLENAFEIDGYLYKPKNYVDKPWFL
ncbi:Piwi domain-containing protein [Infirmifilum sp. NZ]|uniref:Piwi domain-containing protein n=1 Tax=Infirmifilum sp. NZ TaxID=2926850 RepID=UPI0027A8B33E|nr:Piwi domain-containing protein [Infirmifilum sp. NZ]UNQ73580.1 hypothetical protein MOV14_00855 [Infirmifilum sp. NZ]